MVAAECTERWLPSGDVATGSTGVQHATAANGRKTAPSWKMPTAPRFAADKPNKKRLNVTPGPGSYCV